MTRRVEVKDMEYRLRRCVADQDTNDPYVKLIYFILQTSLIEGMAKSTAARSVHHNYTGGLLQHTYEILDMAYGLRDSLIFEGVNKPLLYVSILLHDIGKMNCYKIGTDEDGKEEISYTDQEALKSHLYLSSVFAERLFGQFDERCSVLKPQQRDLIIHCILAHHGRREWGSTVTPCIKEAQLLHYLDQMSGKAAIFDAAENRKKHKFLDCYFVIKPDED
jgi:3'-5' exoribonuclease